MTDEEYKAWCAHFDDRPKTTDDCYTPRQVIDFVEDYFCEYYNIDRSKIIRPFYPGGDFEHEDIHKTRKDTFGIGYKITKEAGIRRNEAERKAGYATRN